MIIVRLEGGLGNQMFQYAFGRHLACRNSTELKLDLSSYSDDAPRNPKLTRRYYNLDIFNISAGFATDDEVKKFTRRSSTDWIDRTIEKFAGRKRQYVIEPHYHFSKEMYELPDDVYVFGYWQSRKYFSDVESELRKDFTFREEMGRESEELFRRIRNCNSVCVNVRRGDFVGNPLHDSVGVDYFHRGLSMIAEKIRDHQLFVFSDDIEWCRENLNLSDTAEFVTHDHLGHKYQDYIRLISGCRHFIIPNSSFSWWAVWLNEDPDKIVVAPKAWVKDPSWNTNDLYPAGWIRI